MEAGKQCAQLASTTIDFGRLVNLHHQINNLNTYAQVTFASLEFSACSGSLTIICNIYLLDISTIPIVLHSKNGQT